MYTQAHVSTCLRPVLNAGLGVSFKLEINNDILIRELACINLVNKQEVPLSFRGPPG
ncbi:hypothetical protein KAJ89_00105 [Candidatus Parcubacteria bacterium]|nr:hypothetical protein [Candidatus Parcubacteria bacterium]